MLTFLLIFDNWDDKLIENDNTNDWSVKDKIDYPKRL